MRKITFPIACLLGLALVFSCKKKEQEPLTAKPVVLESRTLQLEKGTDCNKQPDTLRTDCAIVHFSVPQFKESQNPLGKSVDAWVDNFLVRLLTWSDYDEADKAPKSVDAAVKRFHAIHDEAAGSMASGQFRAAATGSAALNDGKYLTLKLSGKSFHGGNRELNEVKYATFDMKTGKQLTWDDLVKDKPALLRMAEAKVRQARATDFQNGFELDKDSPLALPESYGLTAAGLQFYYQPQEIYGLGDATSFVVPYGELSHQLKAPAPVPAAPGASDPALSIYEIEGDSIVIPAFEIEVLNSPKAVGTLAKKKETIIVSALFNGEPASEKDEDEIGMMTLLEKTIELTGNNRIARFEGLKFHKSQADKLADKDVNLLINVYSGRKSSEDNLLNCGIVQKKASEFGNRRFLLGCSLIVETGGSFVYPLATYVMPNSGKAGYWEPLFITCDSVGNMEFAGNPVKNHGALKATLRPILTHLINSGAKELPDLETQGCLMGNSGAIRDMYDELKAGLTGKTNASGTPAELEKAPEKITSEKGGNAKPAPTTGSTTKPAPASKTAAAKSATTTEKAAVKPAPAKSATPAVTLKQNGDMLLDGKKISTLEGLRKELQAALLTLTTIPDKLDLKTEGETGMGMRSEMRTVISESIAGAKWVRKKNAIAALNTSVGKKLGTSTQLELGNYQTSGAFAYLSAVPKQADGKAIDYGKTDYAKDAKSGGFANNAIGLLKYENGGWKVLTYSIGVSKAPVDAWVKKYSAPKALFGK